MKKSKIISPVIIILLFGAPALTQDIPRSTMERFNSQRIAFFTERLRLTPEEAQVFWPVYNEYQAQKNNIIEERRGLTKTLVQNQKTLSENEIEKLGDEYIASIVKETELLQTYHARFKKVLPIRKVMRIYTTENQFKNHLLRQIQQAQQRKKPGVYPSQ